MIEYFANILCENRMGGVMMKVLVVSDSHSGLSFMRSWARVLAPQVIIHLGDYYDDAQVLAQEFPDSRMIQVPGNCDLFRGVITGPETVFATIDGVGVYLTHGHRQRVKSGTGQLMAAARTAKADVVLYGHTHREECYRTDDGIWVMNPGSCGFYGGSVGMMEIEQGRIIQCRLLHMEDMEEFE